MKGEPAAGGDHQGLLGRLAVLLLAELEADEEEGEHAGDLPKQEEDEEIVGGDAAEHRHHEREEETEEPRAPGVPGGVAGRVDEDERPDAGDQEDQQHREGVDVHAEGDAQRGDPVDVRGEREGPAHVRPEGEAEEGQGHEGEKPESRRRRVGWLLAHAPLQVSRPRPCGAAGGGVK